MRQRTFTVLLLSLSATASAAAMAQNLPSQLPSEGPAAQAALSTPSAPPLRLAEGASALPSTRLRSAAEGAIDQLEALAAWNRERRLPVRVGFTRPLPEARRVQLTADRLQSSGIAAHAGGWTSVSLQGNLVWGTQLSVADAYRLRLHLANLEVPAGTRFWVWGLGEEPQPFTLDLLGPDGGLWTPSVGGDTLFLEVELPAAAMQAGEKGRFEIREVAQSFALDADGQPITGAPLPGAGSCVVDATCVSNAALSGVANYRRAIAHLQFVDNGGEFICSGGLVNDTVDASFIPYLLTANHCFDNQAAASTLEAFWDYRSASCNGAGPGLSGLPKSNGSQLLATGAGSDFTFVRLSGIPGNRYFLGWDSNAVANGTTLHRISHPLGIAQSYSRSVARTSGVPFCTDSPRPQYLYATLNQGGTFGGSSGSPLFLASGMIVGQLSGGCGANPADGCDYSNSEIDGAFARTFATISDFLSPVASVCTPGPTTLCLGAGGRFQVRARWNTVNPAQSGDAMAVSLTSDTGFFWFFSQTNVEMVVKSLNACALNSRFWFFAGGLTNVRAVITVTDTKTGAVKTYTNPQNTPFQPIQDTAAFATCP